MKPDRIFVEDSNRAAYELGYADGLKVGELKAKSHQAMTERDIRQQVWEEAAVKYGDLRKLRRQIKGSKGGER